MAKLLYQGHGSYRITADDGRVLYVDPYAGEGYDKPADIVIITHEMSVVEEICSHVAIIDKSHIAEQGSVEEIFTNPKTAIARRMIFAIDFFIFFFLSFGHKRKRPFDLQKNAA